MYVVSAADVVAADSVVVVLSGADVVESSGIKEIVGAPKRWTWGVLVLATTLLCSRLSILRSSMLLETVRHVSEAFLLICTLIFSFSGRCRIWMCVLGYKDHETLKGMWVVPPTQDPASWRERYGPAPSIKAAKGEAIVEMLETRITHYLNFPVPPVRDAAPMLPISELPTAELQRLYAEFGSVLQSRARKQRSRQHCRQRCRERVSSCLKIVWDGSLQEGDSPFGFFVL